MEHERKIEKLLRAYAKKRRADAGRPLELHPVNRRILQDEAARRAAKPDDEEASLTLWELFRQQWAWLLGFALVVFFAATMFLPALSAAKKKAQNITAMNNLKQIGLAAQMAAEQNHGKLPVSLDQLTNDLVSDKILIEPETGKRFIYVAGGENLDDLPSNSVLAYSPTDKKGRAVLFADGRVERVNDKLLAALTNQQINGLALAKDSVRMQLAAAPAEFAANAPAPANAADRLAPASNRAGNSFANQARSVPFGSAASQKMELIRQNEFQNTVAQAQTVAVLANFQVQQNGSAIRVLDADGSVYNGSLQPEGVVATGVPAPAAPPVSTVAPPAAASQERAFARRDESQTARNFYFRVSGMNQTLKQNVVFAGSLMVASNLNGNIQQSLHSSSGAIGGQLPSTLTNQLPWSNSIITGTAVVSGTNTIEINAVPQSP